MIRVPDLRFLRVPFLLSVSSANSATSAVFIFPFESRQFSFVNLFPAYYSLHSDVLNG
jgi:hypothetical protein